jgi:MFS family permease
MYPFMVDQGIPPMIAVTVLSIINLTGAFGSLGWGVLAERIKIRFLLSLNLLINSIIFLLFFWVVRYNIAGESMFVLLFLLSIFIGLTFGGRLPLLSTIWADFFGRKAIGSIIGFTGPFRLGTNAVGPIFAALFYDLYGNYTFPFYFFAASLFVTGIICLALKSPLAGKS